MTEFSLSYGQQSRQCFWIGRVEGWKKGYVRLLFAEQRTSLIVWDTTYFNPPGWIKNSLCPYRSGNNLYYFNIIVKLVLYPVVTAMAMKQNGSHDNKWRWSHFTDNDIILLKMTLPSQCERTFSFNCIVVLSICGDIIMSGWLLSKTLW